MYNTLIGNVVMNFKILVAIHQIHDFPQAAVCIKTDPICEKSYWSELFLIPIHQNLSPSKFCGIQ